MSETYYPKEPSQLESERAERWQERAMAYREEREAARDEVERLKADLKNEVRSRAECVTEICALNARAEAAEKERDELRQAYNSMHDARNKLPALRARVEELEGALSPARDLLRSHDACDQSVHESGEEYTQTMKALDFALSARKAGGA